MAENRPRGRQKNVSGPGKGVYKRLFAFISALSFAELVSVGILILYYIVNK